MGSWFLANSVPAGETLSDVPSIVFVARQMDSDLTPNQDYSPARRVHFGKLLIRGSDGTVSALLANEARSRSLPVDVTDPDVSYDATRVVFSGYSDRERAWRIWEVGIDGTGLRQLTQSDRQSDLSRYGAAAARMANYDDLDPCYLPDGRICFVSTRYPQIAPDGRERSTNLYVVNSDGSDVHRITSERFGADTPTVDPSTGRVVYSRWWRSIQMNGPPPEPEQAAPAAPEPPPVRPGGYNHSPRTPPPPPPPQSPTMSRSRPAVSGLADSDFTGLNSWFLAGINPDGSGLSMFSGFHFDRELTQAWRPSFLDDGTALALFLPDTPLMGMPSPKGLRRFSRGATRPQRLRGVQTFTGQQTRHIIFASAVPLPDGRVLVSASHPEDPDQFDLYLQADLVSAPEPLHGSFTFAKLDAVPVLVRETPPVIEDKLTDRLVEQAPQTVEEAYEQGGKFTFVVENIHANAPVDVALPNAPPLKKGMVIEFYMSPQRTDDRRPDPPILVKRQPISPTGRVEVELPAGVPLFEALRLENSELAVGRDGQVYHVGGMNYGRVGSKARCIGCHTGHSMMEIPEDPSWTNLATGAEVQTDPSRRVGATELFLPDRLVDRDSKRPWQADRSGNTSFTLSWDQLLEAKEVVVYAPVINEKSDQVINVFTVTQTLGGVEMDVTHVSETMSAAGTHVALDASRLFDSLTVSIKAEHVTGRHDGHDGIAVAEVEVIARSADRSVVTLVGQFIRGDSNCDQKVNMADVVVTLHTLFKGESAVCCEAAADVNDDEAVNLNDAVYTLNFLFRGGARPESPFPLCETTFGSGNLGCAESSCK